MMRRIRWMMLALLPWLGAAGQPAEPRSIDLSGRWAFALLEEGKPHNFSDSIVLPGTTDTNRKGWPLERFDETTHLSRRYSYKGRAWYSREVDIPQSWAGRPVVLLLERTKCTEVFVDGLPCGSSNDISTPQRYDLSAWLTPGRHSIVIIVDNGSGVPNQLYASSHAYTEDTQTNWNGIIGEISLNCLNSLSPGPSPEGEAGEAVRSFLRGRHDACVWPQTGHVPMDLESWRRYMRICQDYGLNHVRFHSWCPPEAAFVAADEAGIILQPELPFWGDFNAEDSVLMAFLHKEGVNILREYGRHPSFRMFALGNELWGSVEKMAGFIEDFRQIAPDKLYTFGSNYYLGYQPPQASPAAPDYFTTCRVGGEGWGNYTTHTRGSFSFADAADGGMINHFRPNSSMNFEDACRLSPVPVISHETGQFQIYPDFEEIGKYEGTVFRPCNMEVFKRRLERAGMAHQAQDFHRASGRWAVQLYKQDIEMDLRTPSMAGFQLLDLQDYPGQGSAYVGVLDAFLDSKHLVSPEEWRQWCSPVVPLLVSDAYCFTFGQGLHAKIQVANYGGTSLAGRTLHWQLDYEASCSAQAIPIYDPIATGSLTIGEGEGLLDVGEVDIDLSGIPRATELMLTLSIGGTDYRNSYCLWAYPDEPKLDRRGIVVASELSDEIGKKLIRGARVLLMPDGGLTDSLRLTVGGLFQTDYWNYRMFKTISENNRKPVSPGTLGLLCDPEHPLFADFPTEEHTNWQWWPVVKESHPFILDGLANVLADAASYRPLVQVIDNVERNHKLGLVFEFRVGKGRLLVAMSDLEKASAWPEGRQFYASVLGYMHSKAFAPTTSLSLEQLRTLLTTPVGEQQLDELNNISPY